MIATYAAVPAVVGASLAIGQAAVALCGLREWSWLSPAVGLALLGAVSWGAVLLPGEGATAAAAVLTLTLAAVLFLRGRVEGGEHALGAGLPVALLAMAAASLPFVVEGHFGIIGTSFNPDMSQHLLATDRLVGDAESGLLNQGYPLGPHAIVAALSEGLGIGFVQGFSGLTVAVAILAPLTALAAFRDQPPLRRTAAALLVGLPYMVASYFAQGAFKETMQALFVLAFALSLREASRNPAWRPLPLRFLPAAAIAAGSVYAYSFPALIWLGGVAVMWVVLGLTWIGYASPAGGAVGGTAPEEASATGRGGGSPAATGPAGLSAAILAVIVFAIGTLPELGRMIDFQRFETFDPNGPGLGNLFGQISPLEALGIWPSGDFRVAPGDGAAPAFDFYAGAAFAAVLLLRGLIHCLRRRESAIAAGLLAVAGVYAAARVAGTPYTAAKAIEVAAPLVTLVILLPPPGLRAVRSEPAAGEWTSLRGTASPPSTSTSRFRGTAVAVLPVPTAILAAAFAIVAAGCSLLAFANAPVGPTSYSSALTDLRPLVASESTLVLAPPQLLEEEHGVPYIAWELRGGRVCIEAAGETGGRPPPGVRFVIAKGLATAPPFPGLRLRRLASPYLLWERIGPVAGPGPCPRIAVRQARQGTER